MRTTPLILLGLFFCIASFAAEKDLYLMYDASCMDKYTYKLNKRDANGLSSSEYYTYQVKINDNERVIFNVGKEGSNIIDYKPSDVKRCGEVVISESFTRKINSKDLKLFLVKKLATGKHKIVAVHSADYFFTTDAEMGYANKYFSFSYNYSTKNKSNLATKDSKGKVYFRSRSDETCPSEYSFRRTPPKNHDPYSDFILVPDVGLVQKKTGLDAAQANANVLQLDQINDIPLAQYMDAVCNGYVQYLTKETKNNKPTGTTVTALEGGKPSTTTTRPSTTVYPSTTVTSSPSYTSPTYTSSTISVCGHLYKDLDRGSLYYNRNTGGLANEECGGIRYVQGVMMSNSYTPPAPTRTPVIVREEPVRVVTAPAPAPPKKEYEPYVPPVKEEYTSRGTSECGTVGDANHHVVRKSETLYRISKMYGISINQIKAWNGLRNNIIKPCSRLRITAPAMAARGAATPLAKPIPYEKTNACYHVVQKGETLYSIATRNGFTVERLKDMNGMKSNTISAGQKLTVNDCNCDASKTTAPRKSTVSASRSTPKSYDAVLTPKGGTKDYLSSYKKKTHTVKEDETLFSIAKLYNTTVDRLRALNNFDKAEIIIPFQKIYVQ